jgi:multiple sugar transport system permease protein
MTRRKGSWLGTVGTILLITLFAIWAAFPFYWALVTSIKQRLETFTVSYISIPFLQFTPTLQNWREELGVPEMQKALVNSIVVSTTSTLLALLLGTMAGYALARFSFYRIKNKDITVWFLSQRVLPPVVVVIPLFLMMKTANLLDTRLALILIYTTTNLPFAVVIMRQIFKELPEELEEAALVDGYSWFGAFFRIAIPLAAPALASTALICLAFAWNEFLFALILSSRDAVTMPVIIAGAEHARGVQFWFIATRSIIAMGPPTILALLAQRFIVRGLTFGAVKG